MANPGKKVNVAVVIYEGVELVDMNGPVDVFLHANDFKKDSFYEVSTVALTDKELLSESNAVTIKPAYSIDNYPQTPDIVIIPGKLTDSKPDLNPQVGKKVIDWITTQGQNGHTIVLSVCIGVFILQQTGLLKGKKATTHYRAIPALQNDATITVIKNVRFVPDGNIVTTGGITSGIDGALHVVGTLDGPDVARQVANIMVYNTEAPLPPDTILQ
jgi:transcriptional regulator GlxA family with amidase domain